ncbi:TM2D2 protein, partial [Erythrocercus mccallii]|nr:TM2D2 protein [Erythrocercus mccallii]
VGYALLCGQAALLLGNLLLLHGLQGNDTEPSELSAWAYSDPRAPLVLCTYLPDEFVECEEPVDHGGNATAQQELGHGCVKFGGQAHGEVDHTRVQCRALDGIECAEPRSFLRGSRPCVK